ncbi:hypothetical protein [Streptomyces sp. SID5910]|uniref:hypothetical protein n=1 Tax=Streptomyces sp. SID5910 TaxID=2690312 RepID=UPI001F1C2272|nr:hypothetical protein [Streptomyces sp. SID5910]
MPGPNPAARPTGPVTMAAYHRVDEENCAVIRAYHRLKGGAALLGAVGPGLSGPFGSWPADGGCEDEDQEHEQLAGDPGAGGALDGASGE